MHMEFEQRCTYNMFIFYRQTTAIMYSFENIRGDHHQSLQVKLGQL